ncbi:cyclic pyranopterin monophosphate synthase MoaC [Clostridium niameyense]|uniref:Cyclic pyranopterin monophosphate synthase n=1 Tax=Clostridium niameyense TaxID=1622073 RepID=A0A6M0R9F0_9CLOT|nr:cyclic pyranopterin monophosphate synthase MoaC [Clostridium niameyense]NEZ46863.1 cyclic pyranopterin monophosphate synthase MoaC [Clostridium niameyense]
MLNHFDKEGKAIMVDVTNKNETTRIAVARGKVKMSKETLNLVIKGDIGKGDVLGVARVAAIMGGKKTSDLIPMCHPLMLTGSEINFSIDKENFCINIESTVKTTGKTGVEMEALTMVSVAALTIYDMCKAVDKKMVIGDIHLFSKTGGKSGTFINEI